MTYSNGDYYIGSWQDNRKNGNGKYYDSKSQNLRDEQWREGKRWGWDSSKINGPNSERINREFSLKSYISSDRGQWGARGTTPSDKNR